MDEFELIKHYCAPLCRPQEGIKIGIGDDAAIVSIPADSDLVVTMDTLVEGVHFFSDVMPEYLAQKVVAVNLSDLAAMGATPHWLTLSLCLPARGNAWLDAFFHGMRTLIEHYQLSLIGGDMSHGPSLVITLQAHGLLAKGKSLLRSTASEGDLVYVSGTLGDAAAGYHAISNDFNCSKEARQCFQHKLEQPTPRVELGQTLLDIATSCIDISDGILADAGHIANKSQVAIELEYARIPMSDLFRSEVPKAMQPEYALTFGDDYELCFTVKPDDAVLIENLSSQLNLPLTCVGRVKKGKGIYIRDASGNALNFKKKGYSHFL